MKLNYILYDAFLPNYFKFEKHPFILGIKAVFLSYKWAICQEQEDMTTATMQIEASDQNQLRQVKNTI